MTDAVEAAREILSAIEAMKGKRLAIQFQDEQTAQWVSSCITNAGNVARAYLASVERERKLREALEALNLAYRGIPFRPTAEQMPALMAASKMAQEAMAAAADVEKPR